MHVTQSIAAFHKTSERLLNPRFLIHGMTRKKKMCSMFPDQPMFLPQPYHFYLFHPKTMAISATETCILQFYFNTCISYFRQRSCFIFTSKEVGPGWLNELGSWIT